MKAIFLLSLILLFACSNDDEPCVEGSSNITDENGQSLFTDENGKAILDETVISCPIGKNECGKTIYRVCLKSTGECKIMEDPCPSENVVIGNPKGV